VAGVESSILSLLALLGLILTCPALDVALS